MLEVHCRKQPTGESKGADSKYTQLSDELLKLTGGSVTCLRIRSLEEGTEVVGNGVAEKFYQA